MSVFKILSKFIDFRMGLLGAIFMGVLVFCINYLKTEYLWGSTTAMIKQAAFTLILGGIFMKGCENIATHVPNRILAIILAVVIPSSISISLTWLVHNLKGTPEPLESTLPTVFLIIPATIVWSLMKRRS